MLLKQKNIRLISFSLIFIALIIFLIFLQLMVISSKKTKINLHFFSRQTMGFTTIMGREWPFDRFLLSFSHSTKSLIIFQNRWAISREELLSDTSRILRIMPIYEWYSAYHHFVVSVYRWLYSVLFGVVASSRAHLWRVMGLSNPLNAALLASLLVGDDSQLPVFVRQFIKVIGIQHLLVVSGFHLGMVVLVVQQWCKPITKVVLRALVMTGFVLLYSVSVGLSISLTRAVIMVGLSIWAVPLQRLSVPWWRLLLAALTLVFVDTTVLQSLSFQLSVTATAVIVCVYPSLPIASWFATKSRFWRFGELVLIGGLVQLFLSPLLIWNFGTFSLLSPFVSALLTPLLMLIFQLCLWTWLFLMLLAPVGVDEWFLNLILPSIESVLNLVRIIVSYFGQFSVLLFEIPDSSKFFITLVLTILTWGGYLILMVYRYLKVSYAQ